MIRWPFKHAFRILRISNNAAVIDAQFNSCVQMLNGMLCDTSIGIRCPNNGEQLNKWELQGVQSVHYSKMLQYSIQ